MQAKTKKKASKSKRKPRTIKKVSSKKTAIYKRGNNSGSMDFYISEEQTEYKPYSVYYDDPKHSIKLLKGDSIATLNAARENSVDMIFADPPYFLSNGGITCHAGRMVSVNKGKWDKSKGIEENHRFNIEWLKACQKVLKPNGTIWVSGTTHVIYSIGFAMQELGFKILNDIVWYKRNAPPNLSCRYFTHSTEIVLWAAKSEKSKHYFDYKLMKQLNKGKQMRNMWEIPSPRPAEKRFGKHPTQKPVELLRRIILASTKEGDLVLDPFTGSSTTGVAAIMLGRRFIGIDSEKDYLDLSVKRLQEAIISPTVFSNEKVKQG